MNLRNPKKAHFCCVSYDLLTDGLTIGLTFLFSSSPETNPVVPHCNKEFAIGTQKRSSGTDPPVKERNKISGGGCSGRSLLYLKLKLIITFNKIALDKF